MNEAPLSLEALRAGDRAEFARMVAQYSPQVYRLGLKITADEQDAEDVLQETFVRAMKALPGFEGRSSLATWLFRIATNEALMVLRRKKPQVTLVEETGDADEEEGVPHPQQIVDWCCLPEAEMLSSETKAEMDRAAAGLSPALRSVFVLRDLQGLSVRETAEVLGVAEAVVKTRLVRARLKLREALSAYFGERMQKVSADEE
ncbi:RNA polymerase sigma factor [Levilinea saccharolytica]|uniref:RNA polymerase sigma factor n=1 Tax=Levilinea saccharolytica TaxID=229921 RepID=A0A0P6XUR1_9CHLR|nr:sigma-70 family RNA polymerase sigma factor [Levilinea saccharolytica]KPL88191.1 hypothetical protein ADN01_03940 [Levilinea saccharolytica]GAP17870.1 RNA polymerase sigma factor, sigma-70 family [Levilinea saccharolytica]